jgi:hypothetical protein
MLKRKGFISNSFNINVRFVLWTLCVGILSRLYLILSGIRTYKHEHSEHKHQT